MTHSVLFHGLCCSSHPPISTDCKNSFKRLNLTHHIIRGSDEIIKLDEWFTLSTSQRPEFFRKRLPRWYQAWFGTPLEAHLRRLPDAGIGHIEVINSEINYKHGDVQVSLIRPQKGIQIDTSYVALLANQITAFWKSANQRPISKYQFENLSQ